MKTFIWFTLSCYVAFNAYLATAEIIAHDGFEDAPIGVLNGQNGGIGFTSAYTARTEAVVTNVSPLIYRAGALSIHGGKQYLQCGPGMNASGSDLQFSRTFDTQTSDNLYISYLYRIPEGMLTGSEDYMALGLWNSLSSKAAAGPEYRWNDDKTAHVWGIRVNSQDRRSTVEVEEGITHFLVAHIAKATSGDASKYNRIRLYVDPTTVEEPETADRETTDDTSVAAMSYLSLRIARSMAEASDINEVDEIRIGTTWADVTSPVNVKASTVVLFR